MKANHFFRFFSLLVSSILLWTATACDPTIPGPSGTLDTKTLADDINSKLKDKCVGYQFVVHYKGEMKTFRSGGDARLAPDASPRPMTSFDKYNVASVSKTITATALIHALNATGHSVDDVFWTYLPEHWNIPNNVKSLRFRDLLRHESGFRTTYGSDYANLKKLVQEGVSSDKSYIYCNANYALMRILIPEVANSYNIIYIAPNTSGIPLLTSEIVQANDYALAYIDYCQKNVFDKVSGCNDMACKPSDTYPGQCYQFPKNGAAGTDFGDMTLTSAERGWNINTFQLANFMSKLHFSTAILPQALSDAMKNERLGYDFVGNTPKGTKYYWKNGNYPGKDNMGNIFNPGELNAAIIGFDNGIQISVILNSQYSGANGYISDIVTSFDNWNK